MVSVVNYANIIAVWWYALVIVLTLTSEGMKTDAELADEGPQAQTSEVRLLHVCSK